jgi:hypothetical protein
MIGNSTMKAAYHTVAPNAFALGHTLELLT